ncbi:MAG: hypothetical protein QS98_C0003G0025 [archaeon GW2011_AR3]|nr:MAG: hypothetical protein QS98_C0003G0025 [archaeon GW2011_AR3]
MTRGLRADFEFPARRARATMALKHKGYFYSMDAFIAMIIVAVGVFVVMQAQSKELPRTSVFLLADDLSNYLTHTKIYDLNEDYYPDSIKAWKQNQTIAHIDNTLLEQAGEFYAKGKPELANTFLSNVTIATAQSQYNFEIRIDDVVMFSSYTSTQDNAKSLISSKSIISGVIDNSNFWGPYKAEIRVWQ